MQRRKAFYVYFIDQSLMPGSARRTVVSPGEGRIGDQPQRRKGGVVAIVERQIASRIAELVAEHRVVPAQVTADRASVGVEHDLVGVEAVPLLRFVRAMNTVAVELSRHDVGKVSMPDQV